MATTARARPISALPAARPVRPMAGGVARTTSPHHAAAAMSTRQMTLLAAQGVLVGSLVLGLVGVVYFFFGDALRARLMPLPVASGATAPAGHAPTVFYRDRGDGTVLVMEIDGKGTRVKGVMDRTEVQLMQDSAAANRRFEQNGLSSQARINALGSSFR